jgi:alpha-galactosidase
MRWCVTFLIGCLWIAHGFAADPCRAELKNGRLLLDTGVMFEEFDWNGGQLIRRAAGESASRRNLLAADDAPTIGSTRGTPEPAGEGTFRVTPRPATATRAAHLEVEVGCVLSRLAVKRVYRLFDHCPAIPCELYLKGAAASGGDRPINLADLDELEGDRNGRKRDEPGAVAGGSGASLERLRLPGNHWKVRAVEFFDVTDRNNTLVQENERLLYNQESSLRGNLLFAENVANGDRLFLLKESPAPGSQLGYPGADFVVKRGEIRMTGLGLDGSGDSPDGWMRAYGSVLGIAISRDELGLLTALRRYQRTLRVHQPNRDEMVMMNTWGDRNRDTKLNEAFCLAELDAGARLGISHFQLDDGWQTGRSKNSAFKGGSSQNIWRRADYWRPDPIKFPHGLAPIIQRGRELGIEVCLWFSPSGDDDHLNWEKDADAMIGLYREYGIRTFKIDGFNLPNKTSEARFRRMFDKVVAATGGEAVFDLDVTAGRRGGYNYFNEYGNIFLENRYTDHGSYYPYRTLRNLWMLARYLPPENLQAEFLNLWRNADKYEGDPYAPATYSFDYAFATVLIAQPLAWLEATGLPAQAFATGALIKKYRALQSELHRGLILPIGDEPDGQAWTGFQSLADGRVFLLVFREDNAAREGTLRTWLPPGAHVACDPVLGAGRAFAADVSAHGELTVELPAPNSFALFHYEIRR